jgi:hypothetical protein
VSASNGADRRADIRITGRRADIRIIGRRADIRITGRRADIRIIGRRADIRIRDLLIKKQNWYPLGVVVTIRLLSRKIL